MKDKATMTTCQESGKGGRYLREKRMTSKIKKEVDISLFVHFCYLFNLNDVRYKISDCAKRFNYW